MNILISGYTGFVGAYLLNHLTHYKIFKNIYCLGRKKPFQADERIRYLNLNKKINSIKTINVDIFLHLAGSTEIFNKDYDKSYDSNVHLLLKILNLEKIKIDRIIFFSTAQVYGNQSIISENSQLELKNYYSITNFHSESIIRLFFKNKFSNYTIIRPFNIYGTYSNEKIERDTLVPTCFCKEIVSKGTLTLLSSGNQYRDFISLKQFSRSVSKIIFSNKKFRNKTVNICSGASLKIIDVAKLCIDVYESSFSKNVKINILSKKPYEEKKLKAKSKYFKSQNKSIILKEMRSEILSMFNFFKNLKN